MSVLLSKWVSNGVNFWLTKLKLLNEWGVGKLVGGQSDFYFYKPSNNVVVKMRKIFVAEDFFKVSLLIAKNMWKKLNGIPIFVLALLRTVR